MLVGSLCHPLPLHGKSSQLYSHDCTACRHTHGWSQMHLSLLHVCKWSTCLKPTVTQSCLGTLAFVHRNQVPQRHSQRQDTEYETLFTRCCFPASCGCGETIQPHSAGDTMARPQCRAGLRQDNCREPSRSPGPPTPPANKGEDVEPWAVPSCTQHSWHCSPSLC